MFAKELQVTCDLLDIFLLKLEQRCSTPEPSKLLTAAKAFSSTVQDLCLLVMQQKQTASKKKKPGEEYTKAQAKVNAM